MPAIRSMQCDGDPQRKSEREKHKLFCNLHSNSNTIFWNAYLKVRKVWDLSQMPVWVVDFSVFSECYLKKSEVQSLPNIPAFPKMFILEYVMRSEFGTVASECAFTKNQLVLEHPEGTEGSRNQKVAEIRFCARSRATLRRTLIQKWSQLKTCNYGLLRHQVSNGKTNDSFSLKTTTRGTSNSLWGKSTNFLTISFF